MGTSLYTVSCNSIKFLTKQSKCIEKSGAYYKKKSTIKIKRECVGPFLVNVHVLVVLVVVVVVFYIP